ncbi:MAG: GTPase ObgE, partial [Deltaproteobacteria bacterium]|nr:GTPase ObgE [Deltaproteobacteria bacterium]
LLGRRHVILLNKIDLIDQDRLLELRNLFKAEGLEVFAISAQTGEGIGELKELLAVIFDDSGEQVQ